MEISEIHCDWKNRNWEKELRGKKKSLLDPSAALVPAPPAQTRGLITLQWELLLGQMLHVHPYGMHELRIDVSQTVYIVLVHLCYGRPQLNPFAERSRRFTQRLARPPCGVHPLKQLCFIRDCTRANK